MRDVITAMLEGVAANIVSPFRPYIKINLLHSFLTTHVDNRQIFGLILLSLMSLTSLFSAEWFSSFFFFLPLIPLYNITAALMYARLYKIPKWHQIKQAEKELPAFVGIYLVMFLIINLYIPNLAARNAFKVLLVIVVLNPDVLPKWIPLYHNNPTRRAVMAFLGSATVWFAYPILAEAGVIGTTLVYSLSGLVMHALLWKFIEQRPKSAVKSTGGRKRASVAFTIDESEKYYKDPMYAEERREDKKRREAIRVGHEVMGLDSPSSSERVDEHVRYDEEGIEFLDEIGPVSDALYRPSGGKQKSFHSMMIWFALLHSFLLFAVAQHTAFP